MFRLKRLNFIILLVILTLLAVACTYPATPGVIGEPSQPTNTETPGSTGDEPTPVSGETVTGVANVESVSIVLLESFPVQVRVTAAGNHSNGCLSIDRINTEYADNTYTVSITDIRPKDALCTEALVPFEESFLLDVLGKPAGTYTVIVNGIVDQFELAVDNVVQEEPGGEDGSIGGVVWHDLCAIAGGEGGEATVPSDGCVLLDSGGYLANGLLEDEPGLEGVEVSLGEGPCPSGGLSTANTDSQGTYTFSDLQAGTYCVSVDPLSATNEPILIPGQWTQPEGDLATITVELGAGETSSEVNFGWDFQFLPEVARDCTDQARFVEDITVEDDTEFPANQNFVKTWRLRNEGTCTWTQDYDVVFETGDQMDGESSQPLPKEVRPGETVDVSLELTAPDDGGTYRGEWLLRNSAGRTFGLGEDADEAFWVQIVVLETTSGLNLGQPDWTDTFNDGSSWFMLDTNQVKWEIDNGNLEMLFKGAGGNEQWGLSNRPALEDFYLEATFTTGDKCAGLDRYGMLVRAPEPNEGYVFNVSCDGRFRLYKWDGDTYRALQEWKSSGSILNGPGKTNRIGFLAEGRDLTLFANDVKIGEFRDGAYDRGRFGLLIGATETNNFTVFVEQISYWVLDQ